MIGPEEVSDVTIASDDGEDRQAGQESSTDDSLVSEGLESQANNHSLEIEEVGGDLDLDFEEVEEEEIEEPSEKQFRPRGMNKVYVEIATFE